MMEEDKTTNNSKQDLDLTLELDRCNNILITGTPGCGKTTLAQMLTEQLNGGHSKRPFKYINVGELIKTKNLYQEVDEAFDAVVPDEDKVTVSIGTEFGWPLVQFEQS